MSLASSQSPTVLQEMKTKSAPPATAKKDDTEATPKGGEGSAGAQASAETVSDSSRI